MQNIKSTKEQLEDLSGMSIPVDSESTREQIAAINGHELDIDYPIAETDYKNLDSVYPKLASRLWRLNNLYDVRNEDGDLVNFELRDEQLHLLLNFHIRNIILKARQLGFTTFLCILILDYCLFNRGKLTGLVADTKDNAKVIFKKIERAWEHFPQELKEEFGLETVNKSKTEFKFNNDSEIRTGVSLRSGTYQAIVVTEFGPMCSDYPEKAQEIKSGTLPAAEKGLQFIESTADGSGNLFHKWTKTAKLKYDRGYTLSRKDKKFFFFPWYFKQANRVEQDVSSRIDARTNEYLDWVEQKAGIKLEQSQRNWYFLEKDEQEEDMKKEHPSFPEEAFESSGNKLFDNKTLSDQETEYVIDQPVDTIDKHLIFKRYNPNHRYSAGADIGHGIGKDHSTIVVIDLTTGEIALTYMDNHIDPDMFAYEIETACMKYGGCLIVPEINDAGITTLYKLNDLDNIPIYKRETKDTEQLKLSQKLGFRSTSGSKPNLMYNLNRAIEDDEIKITDQTIIDEAKSFNKEDARETNSDNQTNHHDLLMGTALAWEGRGQADFGQEDPEVIREREQRRQQRKSRANRGNKASRKRRRSNNSGSQAMSPYA